MLVPAVPSRPRRRAAALALPLAALLLSACQGDTPTASSEVPEDVGDPVVDPTVAVVDNDYEPREVVVAAGTTVTWNWEGRAAHDVEGDGFASELQTEGRFTHTFEDPGSYPYRCTVHPGMTGTVVVVDG